MRAAAVEAIRWTIVALFTAFVWVLCEDGTTATDFGCIVVVGCVALVLVLSAGWINAAPRRENDR